MTSYSAAAETLSPKQLENVAVGVIGCGKAGILQACLFAQAGLKVIYVDVNPAAFAEYSRGKIPLLKKELSSIIFKLMEDGKLFFAKDLEQAFIEIKTIVVAVPVNVDDKGAADYSMIERVLRRLASSLSRETLIILSCPLGLGSTQTFKELIEQVSGLKAGVDFYFAYSPIPSPEEQTLETLKMYKRVVAAADSKSLKIASSFLDAVAPRGLFETSDPRTAEAAMLFSSVVQNVEAALNYELSLLCEKAGLDYLTINKIMSLNIQDIRLKPTIFYEDKLSLLLMEEAENLNVKLRTVTAALSVNSASHKHILTIIREALRSCGKSLHRAKITILGGSRDAADASGSLFEKLINMLAAKGARIKVYDPYFSPKMSADFSWMSFEKSLKKALEGADCIIVLAGHEQVRRLNLSKIKILTRMPAAIVDLEGALDPAKAEAAGFIYRGFGRGVME